MLPPVLLFDLDDTILSFSANADACWRALCTDYSPRVSASEATLYTAIDESREWFWSDPERSRRGRLDMQAARRALVAHAFETLGLDDYDALDAARELADRYTREREEGVSAFPGAIETLEKLSARPEDAWMVGDNLTADIEPADHLGITTVWVDHTSSGLPETSPVRPGREVVAIRELLA